MFFKMLRDLRGWLNEDPGWLECLHIHFLVDSSVPKRPRTSTIASVFFEVSNVVCELYFMSITI